MGVTASVVFYGIQPEMVLCDGVVATVFRAHSIPCERTCIVGKKHMQGSLHPVGYAVDYRTKHIAGVRRIDTIWMIIGDIKKALPCCDVLFEHEGEEQEHIHVEYDPKNDHSFQTAKAIYKSTGRWPPRS